MSQDSMGDELNPEETEKLANFQEITGIDDLNVCKDILKRHFWNVEHALDEHLRWNHEERIPTPRPPFVEQDAGGHALVSDHPHANMSQENGRVVRQKHVGLPSIIFNFLITRTLESFPLLGRVFYRFLSWILQWPFQLKKFVSGLIWPAPRHAVTNPIGDLNTFISEYERIYGNIHPPFYNGTYSQVLNEAKRELKFLVVYLHCKDHQDTDLFCRETLSNPDIIEFISGNCLMWACGVDTSEGYRVSQALRENTYPFVAVIVQREYRMTVVARIEGYIGPREFRQRLETVMRDNEAFLVVARADREERSFNQALRQEQDQAYQESLRADREKEERKRKDRELKEQQEREHQAKLLNEQQRKEELRQRKLDAVNLVVDEPNSDAADCIRILVRLPTGQRLERRFIRTEHTLKDLYYFILAHPDSPLEFEMATSFPKRTLPWQPNLSSYPTLADVGLGNSEAIFVTDLDA